MRIAILDCATLIAPVLKRYISIGAMISDWLSPAMKKATLVHIMIGEGEAVPSARDFDGFIVSGSELGVYDTPLWMKPLRALLLDIRDAGKPIYGICFGHQLMADTFGGKAEKADSWAAGIRQFYVDGQTFEAHVLHGDQVTKVPSESQVTGSADYCPIAVLEYDYPAMSTQFHPEYPRRFVEDVIDLIDKELLIGDDSTSAHQSMRKYEVKPDLYAAQVARFFEHALAS